MRRLTSIAVSMITIALVVIAVEPDVALASNAPVSGAGSTWSAIAVNQWRADVYRKLGLSVNYASIGSSAGRLFYIENQVQFANTEIPFQPSEVQQLQHEHKSYQYLPIVAGGTSIMYNLPIAGHRAANLRLDWLALLGIFTGNITYWDDPVIKADNNSNGLAAKLPHQRIIPVIRSDGSGTSAQLSLYLEFWAQRAHNNEWQAFCDANQINPCYQPLSNWPNFPGSVAQPRSDGVANYVQSTPFAVTYVEAGYAYQRRFTPAYMKNVSGHYALPVATNDSTALTHATFYGDRTQNLTHVYIAPEANAYPISSYSYMVTPTRTDGVFSAAQGATLGKFILYFACAGQQEAAPLGYAPLPPNLVEADFAAVRAIPGAPAPPPLSQCDNPTIPGHSQHGGHQPGTGNGGSNGSGNGTGRGGTPTPAGGSPTPGAPSPTPGGGTLLDQDQLSARQVAVLASVKSVSSEPSLPQSLAALDVFVLLCAVPWFLGRRSRRTARLGRRRSRVFILPTTEGSEE